MCLIIITGMCVKWAREWYVIIHLFLPLSNWNFDAHLSYKPLYNYTHLLLWISCSYCAWSGKEKVRADVSSIASRVRFSECRSPPACSNRCNNCTTPTTFSPFVTTDCTNKSHFHFKRGNIICSIHNPCNNSHPQRLIFCTDICTKQRLI